MQAIKEDQPARRTRLAPAQLHSPGMCTHGKASCRCPASSCPQRCAVLRRQFRQPPVACKHGVRPERGPPAAHEYVRLKRERCEEARRRARASVCWSRLLVSAATPAVHGVAIGAGVRRTHHPADATPGVLSGLRRPPGWRGASAG